MESSNFTTIHLNSQKMRVFGTSNNPQFLLFDVIKTYKYKDIIPVLTAIHSKSD